LTTAPHNPPSAVPRPQWIDLHTHSTFSDGSSTPAQLVAAAREAGLAAIALTDHDTTGGLREFLAAGRETGIETLAGVEMSVEFHRRTVHVLGYGINPADEKMRAMFRKLVEGRNERNARVIRKLQLLGIGIELEEVETFAGGKVVGRPHIAQALIRKGAVAGFDEAFARYLSRGRPAYFERFRLEPEPAIRLIAEAGGVAVLAHPYYMRLSADALEPVIARFTQAGLAGIEAYYTDHTESETRLYLELAQRHDLLVTGGTDYHGTIKPGVLLGRGRGELRIPYILFERLKEALQTGKSHASRAH
jgi:predicted metal-dependent phosphoesterase TrpH